MDYLMQIYVDYDSEKPKQLSQEALRCCQNMQIDHKELLPFVDSQKSKMSHLQFAQDQSSRYHEIKR